MPFSRRGFFKRSAALGGAVSGGWIGAKTEAVSKAIPEPPKPAIAPEPYDIMDDIRELAKMPTGGYAINQRLYGVYAGSQYPVAMFASVYYPSLYEERLSRTRQEVTDQLFIPENIRIQVPEMKPPKQT